VLVNAGAEVSDTIARLEEWFRTWCDGEWENSNGITIESTDNPGWWVKIDLKGTDLGAETFTEVVEGERSDDPQPPWLRCYIENGVFNGAGDVSKLEAILNIFLSWATK
jgi:hypothetical protein